MFISSKSINHLEKHTLSHTHAYTINLVPLVKWIPSPYYNIEWNSHLVESKKNNRSHVHLNLEFLVHFTKHKAFSFVISIFHLRREASERRRQSIREWKREREKDVSGKCSIEKEIDVMDDAAIERLSNSRCSYHVWLKCVIINA